MQGCAKMYGFYIVRTIEANFKTGRLEPHHPEFGELSFPYYWLGQTLFPVSWCLKRIFDGPSDNVWLKFQTLVVRHVEDDKNS